MGESNLAKVCDGLVEIIGIRDERESIVDLVDDLPSESALAEALHSLSDLSTNVNGFVSSKKRPLDIPAGV
jgi:hypothetical protein